MKNRIGNINRCDLLCRVVFCFTSLVIVGGCATTINESVITTLPISATASDDKTVNLSASTKELLDEMLKIVDELSDAMQVGDRAQATQHLTRLTLLADEIQPRLLVLSDQLSVDFERVFALVKSSITFNRPADADKALRFLPLIIDSFSKL